MEATLEAVKRSGRGKNEARRLRAEGKVPAVVYGAQKAGDQVAPVAVAVSPKEMMRILHSSSGVNTLITLTVPGESTQRVLVKEFQLDPVTPAPAARRLLPRQPRAPHHGQRAAGAARRGQGREAAGRRPRVPAQGSRSRVPAHRDPGAHRSRRLESRARPGDLHEGHRRQRHLDAGERGRPDAGARRRRQGRGRGGRRSRARPRRRAPAEPEVAKKGKTDKEGDDKDKPKK